MNAKELIQKAYDSDAFTTAQTAAGYVNPELWNRQVMVFLEQALVVAPLAMQVDDLKNKDGDKVYKTINGTPTAALATAESAAATVQAITFTQVSFEPSEYTVAFQVTDKENRRSFVDLMNDITKKIGYALALSIDDACVSLLQTSAGNSINANSVVTSAIASSDTLDFDDIVNARVEILEDNLVPKYLVVSPEVHGQLLKESAFRDASQFGGDVARTGFIGRVAGLDVFETTQISGSSNKVKSIMIAVDQMGEPCFGVAHKMNPQIKSESHALNRYTDWVGTIDFDVEVLRANGICTLQSYSKSA
jgi:N4-gp56 family major capsid protein